MAASEDTRGGGADCRYDRCGGTLRSVGPGVDSLSVAYPIPERPIPNIPAVPRAALGFLFRHPWLTYLLMGACFLAFGVTSVNLFILLMTNINLFIEYGAKVIDDGALQQLVELVGLACLSGMFYVGFAVCDRTLLRRLTEATLRECGRELRVPTRQVDP